ncbi:pyridoxamine 5'-phosphate oxidase family protein [Lentzea sp. E54]|uniref:pyridoxamine 5'-phosphate oxidase family protein n=1 Tax=Lentzea xerophila TaxID=3435883 RepID=UPI003DA53291
MPRAWRADHDVPWPLTERDALQPARLFDLLAHVPVGRLTFTSGGRPAVSVVQHVVDGAGLLMRCPPHPGLVAAARAEQTTTFEADDLTGQGGFGWWATALGRVRLVDEDAPVDDHLLLTMNVTWMKGYVLPGDDRPGYRTAS